MGDGEIFGLEEGGVLDGVLVVWDVSFFGVIVEGLGVEEFGVESREALGDQTF